VQGGADHDIRLSEQLGVGTRILGIAEMNDPIW
jgi:hypothetical protein